MGALPTSKVRIEMTNEELLHEIKFILNKMSFSWVPGGAQKDHPDWLSSDSMAEIIAGHIADVEYQHLHDWLSLTSEHRE